MIAIHVQLERIPGQALIVFGHETCAHRLALGQISLIGVNQTYLTVTSTWS